MNVSLKVENDEELRAYIKDAIKGQVMSIVREEFLEIVREELTRKIKGSVVNNSERLSREIMLEAMKGVFRSDIATADWYKDNVQPMIKAAIANLIGSYNLKDIVDKAVKEKIKSLLDK